MRVVVVVVCLFLALWLVHAKIVVVHAYDTVRYRTVRYIACQTIRKKVHVQTVRSERMRCRHCGTKKL